MTPRGGCRLRRPRPGAGVRRAAGAALVVCGLVAGCGDEPSGPTMAEVAGRYEPGTLLATAADGTVTDLLGRGATLVLILEADGTTGGRLRVPPGVVDDPGTDTELAGSWTLLGDEVRLDGVGDTFLSAVELRARGIRLVGAGDHADRRFTVVLLRVT